MAESARHETKSVIRRPSLQNLLLSLSGSWSRSFSLSSSSNNASETISTNSTATFTPSSPDNGRLDIPPLTSSVCDGDAGDEQNVGGGKTIDYWGSVAILVNNVTGGGMVLFAQIYQQAGWLLCTLCLVFLMFVCGTGGLMFVECMAMMPHNGSFQRRIEYNTIVKYYCHQSAYVVISVFYQLSLFVTNLSLIIQSAQVADFTIVAIFGRSCTVPQFAPSFAFECPPYDAAVAGISPFAADVWCLPLGLIVTAIIVMPLGFINLDDNAKVQKGAFFSLVIIVVMWIGIMSSQNPNSAYVPVVGNTFNAVIGTSLFNFAFITSVPSWINEKQEQVSIVKVLVFVLPFAVLIFVAIGWLGGTAFAAWSNSQTLLDKIKTTGILGEITFYAFPIIVNLSSIPVLSIFQRYNLIKERICNKYLANFIAVVLPWLVAIPLYNGSGYENLVNWGGVLITSVVNFLVPVIVYILAVRRRNKDELAVRKAEAFKQTLKPIVDNDVPKLAGFSNKRYEKIVALAKSMSWRAKSRSSNGEVAASSLTPCPVSSFTTTVSGVTPPSDPSSSPIARSSSDWLEDSEGKHAPSSPSALTINIQAMRWAKEADRQVHGVIQTTTPRDPMQPVSGSLRIPRDSSFASSTRPPSARSSQQNLLMSGFTSSFTGHGLTSSFTRNDHSSALEQGTEMVESFRRQSSSAPIAEKTGSSSKQGDSLEFLDAEAIQVEEMEGSDSDVDIDEDKVQYPKTSNSARSHHLAVATNLPKIEEKQDSQSRLADETLDPIDAKIAEEEAKDAPLAQEDVVDLIHEDEAGLVWHVIEPKYFHYRLPIATIILIIMLSICVAALVLQIQYQIENPGWNAAGGGSGSSSSSTGLNQPVGKSEWQLNYNVQHPF